MSPSKKTDKPLACYVRVSEQGNRGDDELKSPELQEAKIREWAKAHRVKVSDRVFCDIDVSGGKMSRAGLDAALDGIRAGEYGGIIVARLSRFARSVLGGVRVERQIRQLGGQLVACDLPVDVTTSAGRLMFRQMIGWLEYELDNLRDGTAELHEAKVREGIFMGGTAPAGYVVTKTGTKRNGKPQRGPLKPNGGAEAIREAFELRASGGSFSDVARLLTARGVAPKTCAKWSPAAARSVIQNRVYLGELRSGGVEKLDEETGETYLTPEFVNASAHEAIVSRGLFNKANARTGKAAARNGGEGALLGGVLKCGSCGYGMSRETSRHSGKAYSFYRCKANPDCTARASIQGARIEPYIVGEAFRHVRETFVQADDGRGELQHTLEEAESELRTLDAQLAAGQIKPSVYALAREAAERARDDAEMSIASVAYGGDVQWFMGERETFDALGTRERREALRSIIERAIIKPGKADDVSDRVEIEFAR